MFSDFGVHADVRALSWAEAAKRFLVSVITIARWVREATAEPSRTTIGSLLRAVPPVRCYPDVVRDWSRRWARGVRRESALAQTLARASVKMGRETVRRWRQTPRRPPPPRSLAVGPLISWD